MTQTGAGQQGSVLVSTALFLAMAAAAQAQSGPVGYWKGDDASTKPLALNSVTGALSGSYIGGSSTSPSVPTVLFPDPSSMSFNGSSGYVSDTSFNWPAGGGPVTVAFWNFTSGNQISSAFSIGNVEAPNRFQVHAPWNDNILYWDYGDYTNGRISTSYAAYLNAWTHVALVSEGNGGAFKAIYLNGVLANSSTTCLGPTSALGGANIGAFPVNGWYHNGMIDDFRIYSRVLSAADIGLLAAGNSEPPTPGGLSATPGDTQIVLSWGPSSGATSYNLKWGTIAGGPYPNVISVSGTTYTHTGLTNGKPYFYVVSAVNSLGESPDSGEVFAVPAAPPGPRRTTPVGTSKSHCGMGSTGDAGWTPILWGLLTLAAVLAGTRRR
jgi:hypothetical protein